MMPRKTPTDISEIPTEIFKIPTEIPETVGVFSSLFSGFIIRFPFHRDHRPHFACAIAEVAGDEGVLVVADVVPETALPAATGAGGNRWRSAFPSACHAGPAGSPACASFHSFVTSSSSLIISISKCMFVFRKNFPFFLNSESESITNVSSSWHARAIVLWAILPSVCASFISQIAFIISFVVILFSFLICDLTVKYPLSTIN